MVSLSNLFGFVAIIGTKAVLAFPRRTMTSKIIDGEEYFKAVHEGLSTWELKEGKEFTATSHEAAMKVSQFSEFFNDKTMKRVDVSDPPHGPIQMVAIYVSRSPDDDKSAAHRAAMDTAPAEDGKVKGARKVS